MTDQEIAARTALDSVVGLIDALHIKRQLVEYPEVERQIAFADCLVLNKADLVDAAEQTALIALIKKINPFASVHVATRGEVPLEEILGQGSFAMEAVADKLTAINDGENQDDTAASAPAFHHDSAITSLSLMTEEPLDGNKIQNWLGELAAQKGADLLRYKGIFNVAGEENRIVIQGVQMMLEGGALSPWPEGARRVSRMVIIGRKLDEAALRDGFLACVK
ncbi:MAG TPA: hypothetical protein DCY07_01915 [Rhodospirillaceae bacterium]|nr:hypothetical protein [Rhodospirillaceae bacterium]